jgi:hypothetical protein
MTVPSFGEAAARGQKKPAESRKNQMYGSLAGAGAVGIGAGSITAGYGHSMINAAHATDANALQALKDARSSANKKKAAANRQFEAAGRAHANAVKRYDNFGRWRNGYLGEDHWQSDFDTKMRISRSDPRHRKLIEDEHDYLASAGRDTGREHHRLGNQYDDADDAAVKARNAVKGFKPSAQVGRYERLAARGKLGAALSIGALGAGIYGIEHSRQHTPKMSIQPKYASQAAVGRKADIDMGKMRAAAYRAGKPAGSMSDDELRAWHSSNHGGH